MKDQEEQLPLWPVALVLLGAPAFQASLFFASGVDFATFSHFAFLSGMAMEYVFLAIVWYFLRTRSMTFSDIGLVMNGWAREILVGVVFGVLFFVFAGLGSVVVEQFLPSTISRTPRPMWAALVYGFALITAFAPIEEIVWRGFAIRFLNDHFKSQFTSVLLASLAFGIAHWWGGPSTVVMATFMGVGFSLLYLWRKSLIACIVAHFITDLPLFIFMIFPVALPTDG